MTKIFLTLAGAMALTALAGCSGGGSSGGGMMPNALGYSAAVTFDDGANEWRSEDSKALFTRNDDGSLTVQILEGAYAGEERTFTPRSGDGGSGGQAEAYMTTYSLDGDPIVAVIDAYDVSDDDIALYAFRSSEGLTENMPTTGRAIYHGEHSGFAFQSDGSSGAISDTFGATVNFGEGTLYGSIYPDGPNQRISFDGTINGAEFTSDPGTIALFESEYTPSGINRIYDDDTSVINQNTSAVEGAFYGDAAKAMGGTYVIDGQGAKEGAHLIGGFKADQELYPYEPPAPPVGPTNP